MQHLDKWKQLQSQDAVSAYDKGRRSLETFSKESEHWAVPCEYVEQIKIFEERIQEYEEGLYEILNVVETCGKLRKKNQSMNEDKKAHVEGAV